jgi:hypothetical protein
MDIFNVFIVPFRDMSIILLYNFVTHHSLVFFINDKCPCLILKHVFSVVQVSVPSPPGLQQKHPQYEVLTLPDNKVNIAVQCTLSVHYIYHSSLFSPLFIMFL